jgi:hypothetical protein
VVDGGRRTYRCRHPVREFLSNHNQIGAASGWNRLEDCGAVTRRTRNPAAGQTFTETAMILGILTAIIIGLTGIIVPSFATAIAGLVRHMLVFVGSAD